MKKNLTALVSMVVIIIVIVIIHVIGHQWIPKYSEDLRGTYCVKSTEINVRTGPGTTSEIVTQLHEGDQVTVTGHFYERRWFKNSDDGRRFDYWVQLDNGYYIVDWAILDK